MVAIRHERPSDIAAREALLDRAFGAARFAKTCERLRDGRLPADGLSLVATDDGARRRHRAAVARLDRFRPAGAAARPARRRSRLPQPRHRGGADEPRHRRGAPARPSDHPARRGRAVLRAVRLLRGRDRAPLAARTVRARTACSASPLQGRVARRRARRGPRPCHRPGRITSGRWNRRSSGPPPQGGTVTRRLISSVILQHIAVIARLDRAIATTRGNPAPSARGYWIARQAGQ